MELDIKTLPCGCVTETNKLEKEPKTKTIKTCETHETKEGYANEETAQQEDSGSNSFWIYVGVAVIAILGLAYFVISTYGLPTDLFSGFSLPGLSEVSATSQ